MSAWQEFKSDMRQNNQDVVEDFTSGRWWRSTKIGLWLVFHLLTLGIFLIPHLILHFIFRDYK